MRISESEKKRIRGLHRDASVIKEDWGSKKDEYKRIDGHRTGDVGGHYKAYMEGDTEFNEAGDITLDEFWGGNKDEYKRRDGHRIGDVDGHYKTYMDEGDTEFNEGADADFNEDFGDDDGRVIGAEWQADADLDRPNITEDTEGEETYHYGEDEGEDHDEERELEHDEDMAPHDRLDAIEKHLDALRKDMSYDEDHEDRDEEGTKFESYKRRRAIKEQWYKIDKKVKNILGKKEDEVDEDDVDTLTQAMKTTKGVSKAMLKKIEAFLAKYKATKQ